ncbi:MAG: hypothetical protein GY853_06430 [PVC group bacterium]|nr:hypothetical protein [PVC group bacterium]
MTKVLQYISVGIIVLFSSINIYAAEVKIVGGKGSWELLVDGKPFYINGAGCGYAKGENGEDYFKLAKDMGVNCVRTWGEGQGTKEYLDQALQYGLMVDAGIWLNWPVPEKDISYIGETAYKDEIWNKAINYVETFKDHPAILMWNAGNEVLMFSQSEDEKIAFCEFLEKLIQEIHRIDPSHPVIYAAAGHLNIEYLRDYVPSLDVVGMNSYCTIRMIHGSWDILKVNKPYSITEYGPHLPCDSRKDKYGRAKELGDYQKAIIYRNYAKQIKSFKGDNLGGFVFYLGDTTQESMTWWNIVEGNFKRQSYWTMYKVYTGKSAPYSAPYISRLVLSKVQGISPGEVIEVSVQMREQERKDLSYEYRLSTTIEGILQHRVNEYIDIKVIGKGGKVKIEMPQQEGVYRLYCFVKDTNGNVSSLNQTIGIESD